MSAATATLTIYGYPKGVSADQKTQIVRGTVTISAGTYPAGGFSLSWGGIPQVNAIPPFASTPSSSGSVVPIDVDFKSIGDPPSGVNYLWDSTTNKLRVYIIGPTGCTVSGPLVEFYTDANIPGWIFNDTIQFRAWFQRG